MEYRTLGRTGVKVSPLCLGAMMFGGRGNSDHNDCIGIMERAVDAGINFFDTADVYSQGESEEIVGKALAKIGRERIVLATKVHGKMGDDPGNAGNSRRWITMEVENSLRRLGTDWIDLYQIHRPDPETDIEETLGALTDLVTAGKIRYFGCSTFPAYQVVESHWVAENRGLGRFVTEQPPYSILVRGIEADLLPVTQKYGMGVIPWSPLAGGWLSGKFGEGKENTSHRASGAPDRFDPSKPENTAKYKAATALNKLAADSGMSTVELAVAFTLAHPAVTSPIIGPRTMEQLESQLPAADRVLSSDVLDKIDEIVPPGTNANPGDRGWMPPSLAQPGLRRR